ncbi:MAG: nucleoside phosphorylase [Bacteroidota bacterium]|nr:nucleoside phosphorylase [Bacteroidota bacterium]
MNLKPSIPLLLNKDYSAPSLFLPDNLLREARRQKSIPDCNVPEICVLDPDGDLVDYLVKEGKASLNECWACYHSKMYSFKLDDFVIGIIPCIVGASYAVLVAEQLFVSGCKHLISVTSAGIINHPADNKRFALITEAVRDEGTSYHYLKPASTVKISQNTQILFDGAADENCPFFEAKSWTTDAPYRETQTAISAMEKINVCCVEMEAAALYAFAEAKQKNIICFAHLTNTMAQAEGDFEKGEHFGSIDTLNLLSYLVKRIL